MVDGLPRYVPWYASQSNSETLIGLKISCKLRDFPAEVDEPEGTGTVAAADVVSILVKVDMSIV